MDWLQKASTPFKKLYLTTTIIVLAMITACGGGGFDDDTGPTGSTGSGGTTQPTITITLTMVSATTGQPTQTITSSNPGRVVATVTGITQPVIVTFNTDIASIPISTAITDGNNQATVDILAGSNLGAGTVTASVDTGENASLVYAVGATNLQMGSGAPFQQGVAAVGSPQISAGGTTTITVSIVDDSGNPFTEPVDVNFTSTCSSANPPTASISSPISTINGTASTTYLAQGCVGDDSINVTANAGSINLSATGSVNVLSAAAGSIEFVSTTPENITIKGAGGLGGSESSVVVFRVRDTNGNPVNGQQVDFSLNTQVGGITLNPASATTNAQGLAQTIINSGTVATTVRVTAEVAGSNPPIVSQSTNLVVSTGIPDQDSFSLSASILNVEAWDLTGTRSIVTARLADAFNNPVPDGTAVSFTAEGGSIESSCTTVNGECSVTWTAQFPRPDGLTLQGQGDVPHFPNTMGQSYGGRATITATAIGEESFPDTNGNGRFDASEESAFGGLNVSGLPYDLTEAFVDHNEDGVYNPQVAGGEAGGDLETFVDFDNDSAFDSEDGLYNGVLCGDATICSTTNQSLTVRRSIVLIMSGSTPEVTTITPISGSITMAPDTSALVQVAIADLHNQPMPAGSLVRFSSTVGTILSEQESYGWPNHNINGASYFPTTVTVGSSDSGKSGIVYVTVETPGPDQNIDTPDDNVLTTTAAATITVQ